MTAITGCDAPEPAEIEMMSQQVLPETRSVAPPVKKEQIRVTAAIDFVFDVDAVVCSGLHAKSLHARLCAASNLL